jgi:hypothetical protein
MRLLDHNCNSHHPTGSSRWNLIRPPTASRRVRSTRRTFVGAKRNSNDARTVDFIHGFHSHSFVRLRTGACYCLYFASPQEKQDWLLVRKHSSSSSCCCRIEFSRVAQRKSLTFCVCHKITNRTTPNTSLSISSTNNTQQRIIVGARRIAVCAASASGNRRIEFDECRSVTPTSRSRWWCCVVSVLPNETGFATTRGVEDLRAQHRIGNAMRTIKNEPCVSHQQHATFCCYVW